MLSTLPKLADRSFIIGFFLPTLLFALAWLGLFSDIAWVRALWANLAATDLGNAVFLLLGVWTAGVLLLTLNHDLYRFLEGYYWPLKNRVEARERYRAELRNLKSETKALLQRWADHPDQFSPAEIERYANLQRERLDHFPSDEALVLPTRFGNVIRAFEDYPLTTYGADGVAIWPRLWNVLPATTMEELKAARCQVDFWINLCGLAGVLGLCAVGRLCAEIHWTRLDGTWSGNAAFFDSISMGYLAVVVASVAVAALTYRGAVREALKWGQVVRMAFDCYLPALAKTLGFVLPATQARREAFWNAVSQLVVYGRAPDGRLPFSAETWDQVLEETRPPPPDIIRH